MSCYSFSLSLIFTTINSFIIGDVSGLPINEASRIPAISTDQVLGYLVRYGYLPGQDNSGSPKIEPTAFSRLAGNIVNGTSTNSSAVNDTNPLTPTTAPLVPKVDQVHLYSRSDIPRAIGDFQDFMSLKKTRTMDEQTTQMMIKPRCGDEDKSPHVSWIPDVFFRRRKRRYVTEGSKWSKTALKYSISQTSAKLTVAAQKTVLKTAFERWAEVCPLVFTYTDNQGESDINIRFASRSHGDGKDFDGPGNVLAHAFFPLSGGDVHFDEDEAWVTGLSTVTSSQKNLLKIAIHEIGHSLGLKHSTSSKSVMQPIFDETAGSELSDDDISGIQSLYGSCSTSVDAAFSWIHNGKTFFFKESSTWRFDDKKSESEKRYPTTIQTEWPGVPDNIDEAFLWAWNYRSYFFKGNMYYKYDDQLGGVMSGFPQLISTGWKGVPDNIDAAFSLNSTVSYFFKGSSCYKYDGPTDQVLAGYPKTINECFPGVPNDIDSAVRYYWDNKVYFFKGLDYYRLDSSTNTASGPFQIATTWKNLCFI